MSTARRQVRAGSKRGKDARFEDRSITCVECGSEFTWTAHEQEYYRDKGLENAPRRCRKCRAHRKAGIEAMRVKPGERERIEVRVACANCGVETTVPFYPSQGKPVYCRSCFLARR